MSPWQQSKSLEKTQVDQAWAGTRMDLCTLLTREMDGPCWPSSSDCNLPFQVAITSFIHLTLIFFQLQDLAPSHQLINAPIVQEFKTHICPGFEHLSITWKLPGYITSRSKANSGQTGDPPLPNYNLPFQPPPSPPPLLSRDCNLTDQIANLPLSDCNPTPASLQYQPILKTPLNWFILLDSLPFLTALRFCFSLEPFKNSLHCNIEKVWVLRFCNFVMNCAFYESKEMRRTGEREQQAV